MIHAFIRYGDGSITRTCDARTLERWKEDGAARAWVDLDQPTPDETRLLTEVFGFHPLAVEDSVSDHQQRAKIEEYASADMHQHTSGYYFIVFHGPDLDQKDKLRTKELRLFMGDDYLVTTHFKRIRAIEATVERVKTNPGQMFDEGLDVLLHSILDQMVDAYFPSLDAMQKRIDHVEDAAMASPQQSVLRRINVMKRELLHYRRTIAPQRDVLNSLLRGEVPYVHEKARIYLRDVSDHLTRVVESVELYRDLVAGARDVYLSSLSNNLNQVMKTLTIMSVVALPMTIVTGFFGMNFEAIPGLHSATGFWIATCGMLMAVAGLLVLFRKKHWI